ncbi:MAG: hypothetical protein IJ677_05395 [Alphaproteobacteria bacterium]|nr:hypothetical protein [Alphaproteobacteria bacterium]
MTENNKKCDQHCKSHSYDVEDMNHSDVNEESSGMWEATKEGVAKAWSATKEGASKAWDKTKEVTEDITGFGNNKEYDDEAYFEDESIIDEHGYHLHSSQEFAEDNNEFASFSETDGNITPHHLHERSSQHSSRHASK